MMRLEYRTFSTPNSVEIPEHERVEKDVQLSRLNDRFGFYPSYGGRIIHFYLP